RAEARADVVRAHDEEAPRIERLAGPDEVVPPAGAVGLLRVIAGDVVRGVQRVADQYRVGARGVQLAVGLVSELECGQRRAALQAQRLAEGRFLRPDSANGRGIVRSVHVSLAVFVRRPQADSNRRARNYN